MRRRLVIVLMFLLPLQFSWAAAATYCRHEAGEGTMHLGHHVHSHGESGAHAHAEGHPEDKPGNAGQATLDDDCAYCHGFYLKLVQIEHPDASPAFSTSVPPYQTRSATAPDPDRLERPNWRLA